MDTQWHIRYDTGIDIIDAQHRELLAAVNRLRRSVIESSSRVDIEEQVDNLVWLTAVHFSTEESIMVEEGFPEHEEHKSMHATLVASLSKLQAKVMEGHESLALLVSTFTHGWLKHHIISGDLEFVAFLEQKRLRTQG